MKCSHILLRGDGSGLVVLLRSSFETNRGTRGMFGHDGGLVQSADEAERVVVMLSCRSHVEKSFERVEVVVKVE